MANKKRSRNQNKKKPEVNEELDGFDISINSFGEITSSYSLDKINKFLNRNVDDKKLKDREDIPVDERSEEAEEDAERKRWGKSDD